MMKFRSLTNVRPTKDLGCQVICAPTAGQFKVTPDAAKVLSVMDNDYLAVVMDEEEKAYVIKGDQGNGGKLASANKQGGGTLTFSAANAWDELGGDENFNTHFSIDAESVVEIAELDEEGNETGVTLSYYPLTQVEKVEKQIRKKKDATDEATEPSTPSEEKVEASTPSGDDFEEM